MGPAAAAPADEIQTEGATTDTGLLSVCPECSRAFRSVRALSQHRRRAHPSEYHAEIMPVATIKARWDHEELLILARAENVFQRSVDEEHQSTIGANHPWPDPRFHQGGS